MSDQQTAVTIVTGGADNNIAIIKIDDGKANALGNATIDALNTALDGAHDAGAVVLAGRAGRFSAGFDLSVINSGIDATQALVRRGGELALRLYMFPRPVVAACTGHALAAGAILLMAADHRVGAAGDYKLGLNEINIGLPLPIYLTALAQDRLSRRYLTQATMLATIFDPTGAHDAGFLDEVVAPDEVEATALARAEHLAAHLNPRAFAASREPLRGPVADRIRSTLDADLARFFVDR